MNLTKRFQMASRHGTLLGGSGRCARNCKRNLRSWVGRPRIQNQSLIRPALLQGNASAMLYFVARPRCGFIRGPVFVHFGAGSWSILGKQVPIALEGDLSLIVTSGRVTARA